MSVETIYRPAIRSGMGQRNYYVSTLTYEQIAKYVKMPDEIYQSKKLSDMLQRALTDNAKSIYEYLNTEKERFFNSLVLAVYGGNPKWHEGVFEMKDMEFSNIGVLELTGDEKIFPVDGQHRVSAIKKLVENKEASPDEEVPVIYIAHFNDADGIKQTRKLFTTLNRYAKPVSKSEIIALDEDDASAIITRQLVEDGGMFDGDRIAFNKTESIGKTDKTSFTAIITLGACNAYILKAFLSDNKIPATNFTRYRPKDAVLEQYSKYVQDFWKCIIEYSVLKDYMKDGANTSAYRHADGGNLLFRPAGLKAYVEAIVDIHMYEGTSYEKIVKKLASLNLQLSSSPWQGVLWNNGKMIMNNKTLVKKFIFYNYKKNLKNKKGKLIVDSDKMISEYKALIGSDEVNDILEHMILQDQFKK